METDFPAAHSTDSCWFAIDKDGRVGFFLTGEAGAYPSRCLFGESADAAVTRVVEAIPEGESQVDRRGRLMPAKKGGGMWHVFGSSDWPVIMFLDSLESVQEALSTGRASEFKSREGFAILWRNLTQAEYDRFHRPGQGICKGCNWRFEDRENLARHGIYSYETLGGNITAYPYGLHELPTKPIHVDQLPPQIRDYVKLARFASLNFEEQPVFQPAEHLPCESHDGTYSDMEGVMRSVEDGQIVPEE